MDPAIHPGLTVVAKYDLVSFFDDCFDRRFFFCHPGSIGGVEHISQQADRENLSSGFHGECFSGGKEIYEKPRCNRYRLMQFYLADH